MLPPITGILLKNVIMMAHTITVTPLPVSNANAKIHNPKIIVNSSLPGLYVVSLTVLCIDIPADSVDRMSTIQYNTMILSPMFHKGPFC